MIHPAYTATLASSGLTLADFTADTPQPRDTSAPVPQETAIDGVTIAPLAVNADPRGPASEMLTTRDGPIEPIVHAYHVTAPAGSVRAWVYHRWQFDRLAFLSGRFEVVLYDIRPDSPTVNQLAVFMLGSEQPALLRIPPLVIHGVCNAGSETASFVNMPTRIWDPNNPDKCRLSRNDPRIPYTFNARG